MRAEGALRRRGRVSLMCRGWGAVHRGLWGVLSVTKGFNFPLPPFASSFICGGHWGAAVPTQPSLSLCSIYMDHREQDHNTSSFKVILFFFFLIASAPAFTTLSFMVSFGGIWLRLLQSFFFFLLLLLIRQEQLQRLYRQSHSAILWSIQVITAGDQEPESVITLTCEHFYTAMIKLCAVIDKIYHQSVILSAINIIF